jgi:callose synthase
VVEALQGLWHCINNEFARSDQRAIIKQDFDGKHINTSTVFKDSVVLPNKEDKAFYKQMKRLQTTLETKDTLLSVPKGLEARRRISFFANSLFMNMPRAPQVGFQSLRICVRHVHCFQLVKRPLDLILVLILFLSS